MRHFIFILLTLLVAMPSLAADEMEQTDPPVITWTYDDDQATIYATGDGTVHLMIDGFEVENPYTVVRYEYEMSFTAQAYAQEEGKLPSEWVDLNIIIPAKEVTEPPVINWTYDDYQVSVYATGYGEVHLLIDGIEVENPYFVDRGEYEMSFTAQAYAQEEGKLPSEWVAVDITVPELPFAQVPVIVYEITENEVVVNVEGEGEIVVTCNGEQMTYPFKLQRTDYEYDVEILAQAFMPGHQPSPIALMNITVPAMITDMPEINIVEEETGVWINVIGNGDLFLFVNGLQVENHYYVARCDSYQELDIRAYAQEPGKQESETVVMHYAVPPIYKETVSTPGVDVELDERTGAYTVYMYATEPNTYCFYDLFYKENEGDDWNQLYYSAEYFGPMEFTTLGYWRVGVFAITPDNSKYPSEKVYVDFIVATPVPSHDFVVDGIFYKITSEGKVAVTFTSADVEPYHGNIFIPSQVTHEGTTYHVAAIGDKAFKDCVSLTGVTIGDYVTTIGESSFRNCTGLTSVTMGNYIINIGANAFKGCSSLATVTLGSGVRTIGSYAFADCPALATVISKPASPPTIAGYNCFTDYYSMTLHVHPAVADLYAGADYWKRFGTIVAEDKVDARPGDVTGDGVISIRDITAIINMLLSGN